MADADKKFVGQVVKYHLLSSETLQQWKNMFSGLGGTTREHVDSLRDEL